MTSTVSPRVPRVRDLRADSLAGVLIVLVVFGHVLPMMPGSAARAVLIWVYLFHMPAFVWLSGYLTQYSRRWSVGQLVARLLFPFLMFHVIQQTLISAMAGSAFKLSLPSPGWTLWYLLALFFWRLAAIVLVRTRWSIVVAVVLSLTGGLVAWIGYDFTLSRLLGFLPFFVAGLLWRRSWLEFLARFWYVGAAVLLGFAAWAWTVRGHQSAKPFHMATSYEKLDQGAIEGLALRSLVLLASAIAVVALISVCYRRIPVMVSIGTSTLTVYLLHSIALMYWHLHGIPWKFGGLDALVVYGIAAVAFSWLASRSIVAVWMRPLTDFTWWSSRWHIGSDRERAWNWR